MHEDTQKLWSFVCLCGSVLSLFVFNTCLFACSCVYLDLCVSLSVFECGCVCVCVHTCVFVTVSWGFAHVCICASVCLCMYVCVLGCV